jgi:DNA-binding NarL/FixJ family response regulator
MLTANALDEHVRASLEAGADAHLSKPIRAMALIEAIMMAMAGGAAGDERSAVA